MVLMAKVGWVMGVLIVASLLGGRGAVGQEAGGIQVEIPLEKLARDAEVIVRGTVGRIAVREIGAQQFRFVPIAVKQVVKGSLRAGSELTLRTPSLMVSDQPTYATGEDVILFVRRVPGERQILYVTIGGIQGKYAVQNGFVPLAQLPVDEFIRRIQRAL